MGTKKGHAAGSGASRGHGPVRVGCEPEVSAFRVAVLTIGNKTAFQRFWPTRSGGDSKTSADASWSVDSALNTGQFVTVTVQYSFNNIPSECAVGRLASGDVLRVMLG